MPTRAGTSLKRGASIGDDEYDLSKKPRRSERNRPSAESPSTPLKGGALPSPLTHLESTTTERIKEGTVTPPSPVSLTRRHPPSPPDQNNSPPFPGYGDTQKTQPFSQVIYPPPGFSYEVEDEEAEGVWGYLVPLDSKSGQYNTLVLKDRHACTKAVGAATGTGNVTTRQDQAQEGEHLEGKPKNRPSQGYLIGRHPECGSSRHFPFISTSNLFIQILLLMSQPFRIATVSCSLRPRPAARMAG
jgi:serine/threonine-protein kinase Chk2